MDTHRTNCCCFKIEECGIFVAWTSLIFGLLYFSACVRDIIYMIYFDEMNTVFAYVFISIYTIHALQIVSSFSSIRRAIKEQNHMPLHSPIGFYVFFIFVILFRYSVVWIRAWNVRESFELISAGVLTLIFVIVFTFAVILIRLRKHLKLMNRPTPQTSQFIIQRVPPPGYNTQIEIQPQQQYNPYVIGERQSEYNPQFMTKPPPPYNPDYATQPQNTFTFGTGRRDLDRY